MNKRKRHQQRAAATKPATGMRVGVTWYTEQEWAKVRAAAVDSERFESTYTEWLAMAQNALSELLAQGVVAEPCYIASESLLAWCLAHNKPNNAAARAAFVSELGPTSYASGA